MTATRWWSTSRKQYVELATLHDKHLLAALAKLDRGEYLPGDEPQADPLTPDEEAGLRAEFDAEFQRRAIGPYAADDDVLGQ